MGKGSNINDKTISSECYLHISEHIASGADNAGICNSLPDNKPDSIKYYNRCMLSYFGANKRTEEEEEVLEDQEMEEQEQEKILSCIICLIIM